MVTERQPPFNKTWETIEEPRLWVIGPYMMGFEVSASRSGAKLRVFIKYRIPDAGLPRFMGMLFGRTYARWCTARMVADAGAHFADPGR